MGNSVSTTTLYIVNGAIGVGKSTIINRIKATHRQNPVILRNKGGVKDVNNDTSGAAVSGTAVSGTAVLEKPGRIVAGGRVVEYDPHIVNLVTGPSGLIIALIPEPTRDWRKALDLFYQDRETYKIPLQKAIAATQLDAVRQVTKVKAFVDAVIMERSAWDSGTIFIPLNMESFTEETSEELFRQTRDYHPENTTDPADFFGDSGHRSAFRGNKFDGNTFKMPKLIESIVENSNDEGLKEMIGVCRGIMDVLKETPGLCVRHVLVRGTTEDMLERIAARGLSAPSFIDKAHPDHKEFCNRECFGQCTMENISQKAVGEHADEIRDMVDRLSVWIGRLDRFIRSGTVANYFELERDNNKLSHMASVEARSSVAVPPNKGYTFDRILSREWRAILEHAEMDAGKELYKDVDAPDSSRQITSDLEQVTSSREQIESILRDIGLSGICNRLSRMHLNPLKCQQWDKDSESVLSHTSGSRHEYTKSELRRCISICEASMFSVYQYLISHYGPADWIREITEYHTMEEDTLDFVRERLRIIKSVEQVKGLNQYLIDLARMYDLVVSGVDDAIIVNNTGTLQEYTDQIDDVIASASRSIAGGAVVPGGAAVPEVVVSACV